VFITTDDVDIQYRRYKRLRLLILVVLLSLFQMGISLAVDNEIPNAKKFPGIDFKNGLLKVSVKKQKLKDIMDEIAKKAEIKILISGSADEELTTSFDYLPLDKGLRLLLKDKNYVFKYRPEENDKIKNSSSLINVFVLQKSEVLHGDGLQPMNMNEMKNQIREKLDGLALQNISQNDVDLKKLISKARKKTKGINKIMQGLHHNYKAVIIDKVNKALKGGTIE